MCGIAGIYYKNASRVANERTLVEMRDVLTHRGPDDAGIYVNGNIGLAHRRLSIIDVDGGSQPMHDSQASTSIVYNGEIYNYRNLRKSLSNKGYQFKTNSDTEVLLKLYAHFGKSCVDYLNGIFAFAIWDARNQSLFLARDRMGIKPLYYTETRDALVFGSEIKAVFASGVQKRNVNREAIYEYFCFRTVAGDPTLFSDIKSLLPGCHMTVSDVGIQIEKYWRHDLAGKPIRLASKEAVETLDGMLQSAVEQQLVSDVPLGTFCSGGVDSSLVTAIAAKARGDSINTFSVGFDDAKYDESMYARKVSQLYRTTHHEIRVSEQEFVAFLPDLIRLNDEPLNFANSIHIFAVSQLAKQFVTVVLTGEGADELFLGYPRYKLLSICESLRRVHPLALPILRAAASWSKDHRFAKIERVLGLSREDIILSNAAFADRSTLDRLLCEDVSRSLKCREDLLESIDESLDGEMQLSLNDQQTYLVSILNRQDKMSMGASVEARVPFLDNKIVEFANSIESKSKNTAFATKRIIKKVAERYLPNDVIYRRKSGFGVPLGEWFRNEKGLGGLAKATFNDVDVSEFLKKQRLLELLQEHQNNRADNAEVLWSALNFALWKSSCLDGFIARENK